jgi:hypothetical protein
MNECLYLLSSAKESTRPLCQPTPACGKYDPAALLTSDGNRKFGRRMREAIERKFPELCRWKVIGILAIVLDDMQRSMIEKRYVMKRFEELEARHQIFLMVRLVKKFADSGYLDRCHGSVAEWARTAGLDPFDIWRDVCADAGLDECVPWHGYPKGPKDLPESRGDHCQLPERVAKLLEQTEKPRTH